MTESGVGRGLNSYYRSSDVPFSPILPPTKKRHNYGFSRRRHINIECALPTFSSPPPPSVRRSERCITNHRGSEHTIAVQYVNPGTQSFLFGRLSFFCDYELLSICSGIRVVTISVSPAFQKQCYASSWADEKLWKIICMNILLVAVVVPCFANSLSGLFGLGPSSNFLASSF